VKGGTLVLCKAENLYNDYKNRFEELGFLNVHITGVEKDALISLIRELKPKVLIVGSSYFKCITPYKICELHEMFPKLNIVVISLDDYPVRLGKAFIDNGASSFIRLWDGKKEFYKGIEIVKNGMTYRSPEIEKIIDEGDEVKTFKKISQRQIEIMRLIYYGWTTSEIADSLHISGTTIDNTKAEIFRILCIRNEKDIVREAPKMGIVKLEDMMFYPNNYRFRKIPKNKRKEKAE
jgi:DNA-binding NarL/FixJ family response regulator